MLVNEVSQYDIKKGKYHDIKLIGKKRKILNFQLEYSLYKYFVFSLNIQYIICQLILLSNSFEKLNISKGNSERLHKQVIV